MSGVKISSVIDWAGGDEVISMARGPSVWPIICRQSNLGRGLRECLQVTMVISFLAEPQPGRFCFSLVQGPEQNGGDWEYAFVA